MKYFNFRSKDLLDHPVYVHLRNHYPPFLFHSSCSPRPSSLEIIYYNFICSMNIDSSLHNAHMHVWASFGTCQVSMTFASLTLSPRRQYEWRQRLRNMSSQLVGRKRGEYLLQSASSTQSWYFVLFSVRSSGYHLGCTVSAVSAQWPVERMLYKISRPSGYVYRLHDSVVLTEGTACFNLK